MSTVGHDLTEPALRECIEKLSRLAREQPRRSRFTPMDLYLLEWARFKRRLAEVAAECLVALVPSVRAVYYAELSEDYAGKDIDLIVELDCGKCGGMAPREVEETLEELLRKLVEAAGISMAGLTDADRPFELHLGEKLELRPARLELLAGRRGVAQR